MKTYRKTATVQAKLFEEGDEDGFVHPGGYFGMIEDAHYGIKEPRLLPFIKTLENPWHTGEFGKHYICIGIKGERWLVEKEIFESTYEEVLSNTEDDTKAYVVQCNNFAKWLAKNWVPVLKNSVWMWESMDSFLESNHKYHEMKYTEEQLWEIYKKETE